MLDREERSAGRDGGACRTCDLRDISGLVIVNCMGSNRGTVGEGQEMCARARACVCVCVCVRD